MKTVLISGSQGFIGSYVTQELLDHGYNVIGIDNYSKYGPIFRKHDNHPNFKLLPYDLTSPLFSEYPPIKESEADYIIHLAARIGGIKYFHKYAYDLLAENGAIDKAVFDLAIKIKSKKFIYFSSSMVFENAEVPHHESYIYDSPPPSSTYGFSKLSGEYYCQGMLEQYGIGSIILRPYNSIGTTEDKALDEDPRDLDDYGISLAHVIPDFVYKALKKVTPFPIYGDGSQVRTFTHAKDISRATRLALESDKVNTAYNIASNEPISMLDLAKVIWGKINPNDLFIPKFIDPFKYDVQQRWTSTSKALVELGFEAEISLNESLDEVINHMENLA